MAERESFLGITFMPFYLTREAEALAEKLHI